MGGGGGGKYELVKSDDDANKGFQMMPSQKRAANASGNVTLIFKSGSELKGKTSLHLIFVH